MILRDIIELLLTGIPLLAIYAGIILLVAKFKPFNWKKNLVYTAFIFYSIILVGLVWVGNDYGGLTYNLIPFHTIAIYFGAGPTDLPVGIAIRNVGGNFVLTLPIGVFAALRSHSYSWKQVGLLALLVPVVIEFGQFLLYVLEIATRSVDIDDVIINALGIVVGYYVVASVRNKKLVG